MLFLGHPDKQRDVWWSKLYPEPNTEWFQISTDGRLVSFDSIDIAWEGNDMSFRFEGSNDEKTWTELGNFEGTGTYRLVSSYPVNLEGEYYKHFRIVFLSPHSHSVYGLFAVAPNNVMVLE